MSRSMKARRTDESSGKPERERTHHFEEDFSPFSPFLLLPAPSHECVEVRTRLRWSLVQQQQQLQQQRDGHCYPYELFVRILSPLPILSVLAPKKTNARPDQGQVTCSKAQCCLWATLRDQAGVKQAPFPRGLCCFHSRKQDISNT